MAPPEVVSTKPCPPVPAFKERPILFSAPMVRALLDGKKTQMRRVVNPQPDSRPGMNCTRVIFKNRKGEPLLDEALEATEPVLYRSLCPYGQPGDRLWVRETFADSGEPSHPERGRRYYFKADYPDRNFGLALRWKPSIHMPRTASRIDLEITAVRVERLQDISEADAYAEGIRHADVWGDGTAVGFYRALWEQLNGTGSWAADPLVWVVEFRRIRP